MNDRFQMMRELAAELEALIDRSSLSDVLEALEGICDEKAEHVSTNWQDRDLSNAWGKAARAVGRVNGAIDGL